MFKKSKKYKNALDSLDRLCEDMYKTSNNVMSNTKIILYNLIETDNFNKASKDIKYYREKLENAKKRLEDEFHLFEKYYDVDSATAINFSKRMQEYDDADMMLKTHEYYLNKLIGQDVSITNH